MSGRVEPQEERLARLLQGLCHGMGVQDENLLKRLRGELSELRDYWDIPVDRDVKDACGSLTARLDIQINRLRPRIELRPKDSRFTPDEIYRNVIRACFNVTKEPRRRTTNLTQRQNMVADFYMISEKTVRRHLEDAVDQIAKAMIASQDPDLQSAISPTASTALAPPPLTPQSPAAQLAHLITLSDPAELALNARRDTCRAEGRAFYTFDVVRALIDMPDSRIAQCFDEVKDGLSATIRADLLAMPNPNKSLHNFIPFKWVERRDVQLAWQLALQDGSAVITDIHLFVAVLDGSSETNLWLKRTLGPKYLKLRSIADRMRRDGPRNIKSPTPDVRP